MRVACYVRVSSEEQVLHGISIDAQVAALRQYAEDNNFTIVDEYIDEGLSARKPYNKRPELLRLLSDVNNDKIDIVAFTKLDRWFRNVKEYYKVQDILDEHSVAWQAIQEDYETVTANGRFKVNIMLSLGETEADRTSERVKFVMGQKRTKGEPLGRAPYGYRIQNKTAVIVPEEAENVRKLFNEALQGTSRRDLIRSLPDKNLTYESLRYILSNSSYVGDRNGVKFPPIIDREIFNKVQEVQVSHRYPRKTTESRVYIFSGLLCCPVCGARLAGTHGAVRKKDGQATLYYRCPRYTDGRNDCNFTAKIKEKDIESFLLENIESELQTIVQYKKINNRKSYEKERKAVKEKLRRLNDLYIEGDISKDEYNKRKRTLDSEYASIPEDEKEIDTEILNEKLFAGWQDIYSELSQKAKQSFWSQILEKIEISTDCSVKFFAFKGSSRN